MGTFKHFIDKLIKTNRKISFIDAIKEKGKILDVGCGNDSPWRVKSQRPDLYYVGLDIGIYNQSTEYTKYANEFLLTEPDSFHTTIAQRADEFDAIICAHNLEHCNDYVGVTRAMAAALKKGGMIYITFPCEASVNFPPRKGCLNFYDDDTHKNLIGFELFLGLLKENGLEILQAFKRHRPLIPFFVGLLFEPIGRLLNKQAPLAGTWALYGFETVIVARKK